MMIQYGLGTDAILILQSFGLLVGLFLTVYCALEPQ